MKRILMAAGAAAILAGTAACADGYGYRTGVAVGYVAYYDDFYGPFYDGYWRRDGSFYYRPGPGRPFVRDRAGHFRREPFPGARSVQGQPQGDRPDRRSGGRR